MKRNLNEKSGGKKIDVNVFVCVFIFLYNIETNESLTSTSCHTDEDLLCAMHRLICPDDARISINDATYGYKIRCDSPDFITNCSSATISQCCMESVTDCGSSISFEVLEELRSDCLDKSRCDVPGLGIQRSCSRMGSVDLSYNSYSKIDYSCEMRTSADGTENEPSIQTSSQYESFSRPSMPSSVLEGSTSTYEPTSSLASSSLSSRETPVLSSQVLTLASTVWAAESSSIQIHSSTRSSSKQSSSPHTTSLLLASTSSVVISTLSTESTQSSEPQKDIRDTEKNSEHPPTSIFIASSIDTVGVHSIQIENTDLMESQYTLQTSVRNSVTHSLSESISSLYSMYENTEDSLLQSTPWIESEFPKSSTVDLSGFSTHDISTSSQLLEYLTESTSLIFNTMTNTVDERQETTEGPLDNTDAQESDDTVVWTLIGIVIALCIIPSLVVILILLHRKRERYIVKKKTTNRLSSVDYDGKMANGTDEEREYAVDLGINTSTLTRKTVYNPIYVGSPQNIDDDNINVYEYIDDKYDIYVHPINTSTE